MDPAQLIIIVPLATWLGAKIGRAVPWSTRRAFVALVFVVPLALAAGVPVDQVVLDAVCLGTGFLWQRRSRSSGGHARRRPSSASGTIEPIQMAEFSIGSRERFAVRGGETRQTAAIRGQRREEMARLRAQRKGKKSPIF